MTPEVRDLVTERWAEYGIGVGQGENGRRAGALRRLLPGRTS